MKREELREKLREITTSKRVGFLYAVGNDDLLIDELENFIEQELSKAREEGKKEAFTKDEWFMLKLAMNDIFNNGNTAYEEISEKIESYLN
jgi:hypothetical protein